MNHKRIVPAAVATRGRPRYRFESQRGHVRRIEQRPRGMTGWSYELTHLIVGDLDRQLFLVQRGRKAPHARLGRRREPRRSGKKAISSLKLLFPSTSVPPRHTPALIFIDQLLSVESDSLKLLRWRRKRKRRR